jgi:hypothetical protein
MHAISKDTIFVGERKKRGILKKSSSLKHPDIRQKFFTWYILKGSSYVHSATAPSV